jgi:hypothetical protein
VSLQLQWRVAAVAAHQAHVVVMAAVQKATMAKITHLQAQR